jgi:hypothetical protein
MRALRRSRGVAFLCCADNEEKLDRLRGSIDGLERPAGVDLTTSVVWSQTSLARAYNLLLERAAAWRYKVYVHQDVVILNRDLIHDLLRLFRRRSVGLVGVAGVKYLPPSCVWWDGSGLYGQVLEERAEGAQLLEFEQPRGDYEPVEALDGLCLVTQHDIPWDEAVPGFHFYDVAQSTRFVLSGCEVVVPRQDEPWFLHGWRPRDDLASREAYFRSRDVFRERYGRLRERHGRSRRLRYSRRLAVAAGIPPRALTPRVP